MAKAGKDWWDKAYVIFTGLLVIIGALGVRSAIKSLRLIERQTDANDNLIKHAGIQAEAAKDAAEAAFLNAQAVINSERPWVVVTTHPDKERRLFMFKAKNHGRTPAKIISEEIGHEFAADPMNLPSPPNYKPAPIPHNLLAPEVRFPIYRIEPAWWIINQRPSPGEQLVVFGRILYFDLVKGKEKREVHETRWCLVYVAEERRFVQGGPDEYHRNT